MMSFEEKLAQAIQNLQNADKPDCPMDCLNNYADFIELLVLFSGSDGVSYGDIQDRFFGELDENSTSEKNDKNESFIDSIYKIMDERMILYKDTYPFDKKDEVILLKKQLSIKQKIYLFLLLSSSLDIFKSFNAELTTDFETLCYKVMQLYLPNAVVKAFGKNSEYTGSAKVKIKKLAEDLGVSLDDYDFEQIGDRNSQERGLDIVGWLPFDDNCSNMIIFLGQCACGKQYESKQHDVRRFKNYYRYYKTKPQCTLFIPYSLINPGKRKFYHSDYIEEGYLLFERKRILGLLEDADDAIFNNLKTKPLVEKCITN